MTKTPPEQIAAIRKLRAMGYTYRHIANELGVSIKTSAYYAHDGKRCEKKRDPNSVYYACIYPNIAKWLIDNNSSYEKLAEKVFLCQTTLGDKLRGQRPMDEFTAGKILEVTGMSRETAFQKREASQND